MTSRILIPLRAKLANRCGETLVETLAAILISTLAVLLLTTSVLSAANMNKQAQTRDADLLAQENTAATGSSPIAGGIVTWNGASLGVTYDFSGGADMVSYTSE